jgi:hypothetical protein
MLAQSAETNLALKLAIAKLVSRSSLTIKLISKTEFIAVFRLGGANIVLPSRGSIGDHFIPMQRLKFCDHFIEMWHVSGGSLAIDTTSEKGQNVLVVNACVFDFGEFTQRTVLLGYVDLHPKHTLEKQTQRVLAERLQPRLGLCRIIRLRQRLGAASLRK